MAIAPHNFRQGRRFWRQKKQVALPTHNLQRKFADISTLFLGDQYATARFGRLAGSHMGQGRAVLQHALNEHFHPSARLFQTEQSGRYYPGVVENQ